MSRLAAGVIGLGVGEQHIRGYREAGCDVVAICDLSAEVLERVGREYPGARLVDQADELLDDPGIDVVSIASYDDDHAAQVLQALRQDKHVFVEKPLCQLESEAEQIHALLAGRPHLRLSSNLPLRASPRFRELRRSIEAGGLGRVFYVEGDYEYGRLWKLTEGWRGDLERYSVFLGGGVHIVDLILWLTGDRVTRVSAAGSGIATEGTKFAFDDLVVALLELESGAIAKVAANFACVHPHYHGLRVFGTGGTFLNGLGPATLWEPGAEGPISSSVDLPYPGVGKADLIPSFVDSIRGKGEAEVTADEVFAAMAVCFAVERAIEAGQPCEVRGFS